MTVRDRERRYDEAHRLSGQGLIQEAIAQRLGVTQASVSYWLRGIGSPYRCGGCSAQLVAKADLCGLCEAEMSGAAA